MFKMDEWINISNFVNVIFCIFDYKIGNVSYVNIIIYDF